MTSKDKKRSSEKRKEKSRDAARCRRSKETEVFNEMAAELPLPPSIIAQLDKASVMRLTISNLRVQGIMEKRKNRGDKVEEKEPTAEEQKIDGLYSKALEGFVFILSKEGDIVYVSEDVIKYLGIQQVDLMGQSVYEFAHPCDHSEIKDVLTAQSHGSSAKERRAFFLRLKCTLTNKGRSVNLKSATYKVIMCTGYLYMGEDGEQENTAPGGFSLFPYLLGLGEPIPDPAYIEVPLDSRTFVSRHNLDMRFIECDDRIKKLIGYGSEELVGKSLFDFHHAEDSELIRRAYKTLFEKGQTMTEEYRFLAKRGGMVRIITQATVIRNNRTQKQQWVVCVHYVLSEVEEKKAIMAVEQQQAAAAEEEEEEEAAVVPEEMLAPYIGFHTDKIFAPRTKDMDEGLLPASIKAIYDDDDLACLAPWAGEPNKELGFPDLPPSFCFEDEMEGSPVKQEFSPVKQEAASGGLKEEPGLALRTLCRLREECASNSVSPVSIPSRRGTPDEYLTAANPKDLESMDRFFSTMSTTHSNNKEEKEMDTRAPYVPMDMSQDFHLAAPSSDCLLSFPNDFNPGLFGKTETVFMNKSDFMTNQPSHRQKSLSMRDMMDGSPVVASIHQPPNTMPMQVKRPLDMNSLEKGPPPSKTVKMENGQSTGLGQSDSVLLNLLLTGEDKNHGYKVQVPLSQHIPQLAPSNRSVPRKSLCHLLLPRLTQQDCEVNAPTPNHSLLMGPEILQALEASGQETNGV